MVSRHRSLVMRGKHSILIVVLTLTTVAVTTLAQPTYSSAHFDVYARAAASNLMHLLKGIMIGGIVGTALLVVTHLAMAVSCCNSASAPGPYGEAVTATACAAIYGTNKFNSYGSARISWTPAGCGFSESDRFHVRRGACFLYPGGVHIDYSPGEAGEWIYAEGMAYEFPVKVETSIIASLRGFCAVGRGVLENG